MKRLAVFFILVTLVIVFIITRNNQSTFSLEEKLRSIESFISEYRGLPVLSTPTLQIWTAEELQNLALKQIESDTNASLAPENSLYSVLGFVEQDFQYKNIYPNIVSLIGGFYDQNEGVMSIVLPPNETLEDDLPFYAQIVYAHEFVHALQDQHFDLENLMDVASLNYDQYLAIRSLVEGDAQLTTRGFTEYLSRNYLIYANTTVSSSGDISSIPDVFIDELAFIYQDGLAFVSYLYSNGRWSAVNDAYINLPQSTEQILQPSKYIAGEAPIPVELTDVSAILGEDWQLTSTGTIGLFYLREYLSQYLRQGEVYLATNGWGGDTMTIYYQPDTDESAWVMGITWDDPLEKELREFGEGYVRFLENQFDEFTDTPFCGVSDAQAICFATTDTTSFIASAPTTDLAQALLTQLIGE